MVTSFEPRKMNNSVIAKSIEIARALSPTNLEHRCSHVAFLVKKNRILHIGQNKIKTTPITTRHPYVGLVGRHAEVDAIFKSQRENLEDFELLVLRIARNTGKLTMSKPCVGCRSIIKQFGIKKKYYSDYEGNIVREND